MQSSYLSYAMSVIVSRALPDVRDGLKPVHRRILYAAHESGYHWNRKYVKSARPVADVMGKYHPHGDASIYDALVRMAQDWSLRVPLIDGQGNFGSIDGDPPAAMRYTESRLTKVAHEILEDSGKDTIEQRGNDRESIIITEVPYQVNKASMIEKMAELVRDKRIEGISDIRDESDRQGYRVVIELKRDAVADVILNQLYRFTPLQTSFGANMVALNGGKPEVMNLTDMLKAFVAFREEVITRRTKFLLRKARDRAHVLVGLAIAVANIDEVIKLIRTAPDPQTAREQLMERRWPSGDVESLILLIYGPRHRINEAGT